MRSHLLQLLDDVSDDEINQGHGPALTNAIDHVNGEAPLRALVPNPALQDADVVAAGQAGSFATPSVRMTSTSTSHDLTLDNAHFGGRVPPCETKQRLIYGALQLALVRLAWRLTSSWKSRSTDS